MKAQAIQEKIHKITTKFSQIFSISFVQVDNIFRWYTRREQVCFIRKDLWKTCAKRLEIFCFTTSVGCDILFNGVPTSLGWARRPRGLVWGYNDTIVIHLPGTQPCGREI